MSVMKYKDPETGEVKKVFAPTFDAYTKTESDTLLAGKAPSGYGLGTAPKQITDWNDAKLDGWYCSDIGALNSPDSNMWFFGIVHNGNNPEVFVQEVWHFPNVDKVYHWQRFYYPGVGNGTPWEWIDPPMYEGVVYRTTERHLGKPVYKKMDSNGVIWWSTDQSTWKREAERVGAAPVTKKASITLSTNWTGDASPYTQSVTISGTTANSKVDLQPDATAIAQMADDGTVALYIANDNGTLTAYAIGEKPTVELTIQATITEVSA